MIDFAFEGKEERRLSEWKNFTSKVFKPTKIYLFLQFHICAKTPFAYEQWIVAKFFLEVSSYNMNTSAFKVARKYF